VSSEDQVSPEGDVERDAAAPPTSDVSADGPVAMLPETAGAAKSWFDFSWVFSYVGRTLSSLASVLGNAFLILITVVFILLEAATIPTKLRAMPGSSTRSLDNLDKIVATINQYMAIKTITSIATGVLVTIWLSIVGVDFALLWGLFAFLLNYVPNIGSILAAVPAVLLAFIQLDLGSAAAAALGYVVINILIGYVIEPRFMGRGLGLSTLVVFLSLVIWGWVLGPVGMLLSVPLTMTAKITLEGNDDTRWIAILLGTGSDAADSVSQLIPESVEELTNLEIPPS
jgi:predicted PurR-regulated permease PerM